MDPNLVTGFQSLFRGRDDAWGTGKGAVVRGALRETHFAAHLAGWQPGLGIFPLRDDGTVYFGAVDLDEPNRDLAFALQELIPGVAFIERSRSGNFHVWVFFSDPLEAWVVRGILKAVCESVGRSKLEVFPKQSKLLPGMVGNYINLPYFGDERPILSATSAMDFVEDASDNLNDPQRWLVRARRLGIQEEEFNGAGREQGTSATLHVCAEKIIRERETNPVGEGHRHVVLFNLAKMLLDWREIDDDEAFAYLQEVNYASPDPLSGRDLRRAFDNAKRGGYTSTGCDDPLMAPYTDKRCKIANGSAAN